MFAIANFRTCERHRALHAPDAVAFPLSQAFRRVHADALAGPGLSSRQGHRRAAGCPAFPDRTAAPVKRLRFIATKQTTDFTTAPTDPPFHYDRIFLCTSKALFILVTGRVWRGRSNTVFGRGLLAVPGGILLQRHRQDCHVLNGVRDGAGSCVALTQLASEW